MNTQLYFLIKRLCDLELEFSDLTEEEKEIVVSASEEKLGTLSSLFEALEDFCIDTFIDDDE
ncbi:MAG: hypothetical protein PWP16_198 [Eubacteriaceae bacterium]|jgi:NDP-sugar pyrophosphorylase family protein|nr:hypothetical protein [Eubacteriaceae bacterium]MDK2904551.1 hypothetical protein [Eubacteriaceae bacterium]MDK2935683.1 hypothetical protein [Eubacteriaceae bacterium]MDN5306835.1 hypothetical protein [Eubacteriaceae bacterium]